MANVNAALVQKQVFDEGVQDELRDYTYAREFADVRTEAGEFIYKRKGSDPIADMTTDGTLVVQDFTYDKDSIGLAKQAYKVERITLMDATRQGFLLKEDRMSRYAETIGRKINRDTILTSFNSAGLTVTDGDLPTASNGGATNPILVNSTSADDLSVTVTQKLQENNALDQMPYMIMRPKDAARFGLFAMGTGATAIANLNLNGGYQRMTNIFGFDIFVTNDVPYSATITLGAVGTAADTLTIKGVVWTLRAAAAVTGEITIGGTSALTAQNIVNAINGSGTGFVEVSSANRYIIKGANISATLVGSVITVTSNVTMANAKVSTAITLGTETACIIAGARKSTVLRLPDGGYSSQVLTEIPLFTGTEVRATQIFDNGVWSKTAPKIVKVPVVL